MAAELASIAQELLSFPTNDSVEKLESFFLKLPQVEIKTEHSFAPGLYIRQITIPAGVIATGAAAKQAHLSVMVSGKMLVRADGGMRRIEGYQQWIAPAGIKRVGMAEEETVWFTVHPNPDNLTDIDALEELIFEDAKNLLRRRIAEGRAELDVQADRDDFRQLVRAAGFTLAQVREQSENTDDQIQMPNGCGVKVGIDVSEIEGRGVFLNAPAAAGEVLAPARVGGKRTPVGRYTNHSRYPNAEFFLEGEDIYLQAIAPIAKGQEVTVNYRQALSLSNIQLEGA